MNRALVLLAAAVVGAAGAQDELDGRLVDCKAITDPAERLACYDAQAQRPVGSGAATPAAGSAPAAGTAPAPSEENPSVFGMPKIPVEPDSVQARLVETLDGWRRGTVVKLDNGQTWRALDTAVEYPLEIPAGTEVTIKRSTFGAYWMDIPAIQRRVKVKRIS